MKRILFCLHVFISLNAASQDFILVKDTVYAGKKDSIVSVQFKLTGMIMQARPKVAIKALRGTAVQGRDFDFLDGDGLETPERKISIVTNNAGEFKMKVSANIDDTKELKLKILIDEGGIISEDIVLLFISPKPAEPKEEGPKKPAVSAKSDTLEFINYVYNNVDVYKNPVIKKDKIDRINIQKIKVDQITALKYRVQIITTDNEVYFNTIELTTYYQFKEEDKVYLFGNTNGNYVRVRDVIILNVQEAGDKPLGTPETLIDKFKI